MACHQRTIDQLREAGYRLTPQRLLILEAIHHLGGHVNAEQVLGHVQQSYPYVDLSTIYRTFELLVELQVVHVFERAGHATEYELAEDPHHHLVCQRCGSVQPLADYHLQELQHHLLDEHGFQADLDHLAIPGLCVECRATRSGDAANQGGSTNGSANAAHS